MFRRSNNGGLILLRKVDSKESATIFAKIVNVKIVAKFEA